MPHNADRRDAADLPDRPAPSLFHRIALQLVPGLALAGVLIIIVSKVVFRAPEYDESEVLHASWMIAHGHRVWVDFLEHHSPLFNTINARLFDTDSPFFILYAKLFALFTYLLGAFLFAVACDRWLNVQRRFRASFFMLTILFYLALTSPVAIGIVRPENYGMLALIAGAIFAHRTVGSASARSSALAFLSAFLLAVAVSFSPRSVILVLAIVAWALWTMRKRADLIVLGIAAFAGGIAAILLNAMVAPLYGFYLWVYQFNLHMLPYRRWAWPAAYGSIMVAIFSIALTGVLLGASVRFRSGGRVSRFASLVDILVDRRLFAAQALLFACGLYLFADHVWGQQSFGGIAVAASFYMSILVALSLQIVAAWENRPREESAPMLPPLAASIRALSSRPRALMVASLLAITVVSGLGLLFYVSADKIVRLASRLQPSGMLADIELMLSEKAFRLTKADNLLPLGDSKNLGEWLLWSQRECRLFRNERVSMVPVRHPICVEDTSFYGYGGEHFRAMAAAGVGFVPDPPYNVVMDILTTKPALIERDTINGPLSEIDEANPQIVRLLQREYTPVHSEISGHWAWIRTDFLRRQ